MIRNYNIASGAAQSNSVYVSVLKIPIVHADIVSKSLRQNFFFASDLLHNSTGYVIKQLVNAFSSALSSYGARGKFGGTLTLLSCSPNLPRATS